MLLGKDAIGEREGRSAKGGVACGRFCVEGWGTTGVRQRRGEGSREDIDSRTVGPTSLNPVSLPPATAQLHIERISSTQLQAFVGDFAALRSERAGGADANARTLAKDTSPSPIVIMLARAMCVAFVAFVSASAALSLFSAPAAAAAASQEGEGENSLTAVHDLYDLLLQKAALEERLNEAARSAIIHQVVRKSSRSPSLRLRFGRRADIPPSGPGEELLPQGPVTKSKWPSQPESALYP
ncbi:uncharacterized protein LOC124153601 [Ischnura elegans]|uniref:uncharacterized protein LOC124153601 n=1 Tax=Ischnura elegans TaxID=197161 RepID=UPI001ED88A9E|nr:uncharacterized protein LOC124153601 [Ischnura elegans]